MVDRINPCAQTYEDFTLLESLLTQVSKLLPLQLIAKPISL